MGAVRQRTPGRHIQDWRTYAEFLTGRRVFEEDLQGAGGDKSCGGVREVRGGGEFDGVRGQAGRRSVHGGGYGLPAMNEAVRSMIKAMTRHRNVAVASDDAESDMNRVVQKVNPLVEESCAMLASWSAGTGDRAENEHACLAQALDFAKETEEAGGGEGEDRSTY